MPLAPLVYCKKNKKYKLMIFYFYKFILKDRYSLKAKVMIIYIITHYGYSKSI
jgi:hypothetical protein